MGKRHGEDSFQPDCNLIRSVSAEFGMRIAQAGDGIKFLPISQNDVACADEFHIRANLTPNSLSPPNLRRKRILFVRAPVVVVVADGNKPELRLSGRGRAWVLLLFSPCLS